MRLARASTATTKKGGESKLATVDIKKRRESPDLLEARIRRRKALGESNEGLDRRGEPFEDDRRGIVKPPVLFASSVERMRRP